LSGGRTQLGSLEMEAHTPTEWKLLGHVCSMEKERKGRRTVGPSFAFGGACHSGYCPHA